MRKSKLPLRNSRLSRQALAAIFSAREFDRSVVTPSCEFRRVHMVAIHGHATRTRSGQRQAVLALGDAWEHASATFHEWRRRSRERAELAALDDRTLKDIGLTRADAEFLSNKPFWRE
jgi:uncharacterized protein YjiS (DUF1127 family)